MAREKVKRVAEYRLVIYDERHWELLKAKRNIAMKILRCLSLRGVQACVHGSLARGDVHEGSDVDVTIMEPVPSFLVELALEACGFTIYSRTIIQATPSHTPKAYLVLDPHELIVVSFPLARLLPREYEFYKWGGVADLPSLEKEVRVPGVSKRLVLIEPTESGHRESPVIGREEEVAKVLGISVDTVRERVRVLTRRDELGRTGVYRKVEVSENESIEQVLASIAARDHNVRRVLRERGT